MFAIMEAAEAAELIKDGDVIGLNSFAATANPEKIHEAIEKRFRETGHPRNLTLISSAGFGVLDDENQEGFFSAYFRPEPRIAPQVVRVII